MSEVKKRKLPKDGNSDIKKHTRSSLNSGFRGRTSKLKFYFLSTLIFTIFLIVLHLIQQSNYSLSATLLDSLMLAIGIGRYAYVAVIDAGSTGSRILCYTFISTFGEKSFKLEGEFFKELKPGISAFVNNPAESTKNLNLLLESAKKIIPKEEWPKTPLVMKATAGLRLLPGKKADALLNEARKVLRYSGFKVDENSVSIVDGTEEGLLSWFTINFLLNRLNRDPSKTVVALDLGGGSTQVSFIPSNDDKMSESDADHIIPISIFEQNLMVFSRSYLGLGLNEGRKRILQLHSNHTKEIVSPCINPLVKTTWTYSGTTFNIRGSENPQYLRTRVRSGDVYVTPIVNYTECERDVKSIISKYNKTPSLHKKEIFAFSYYFDKSVESGLVDVKKGGPVLLWKIINTAERTCLEPNVDQPFLCLDLIFISVLLSDTFGVSNDTTIHMVKWVEDHEVSWALGAAFLNLQNQFK